jgi:hypothetical protein
MDRFIPARSGIDMKYASYALGAKENTAGPDADSPTKVSSRSGTRACLPAAVYASMRLSTHTQLLHVCRSPLELIRGVLLAGSRS